MNPGDVWSEIVIAPRLGMVPVALAASEAMADYCGFSQQAAHQIRLALEEVLTTVLRYAFAEDHDGEIRVRFELGAAELRIVVREKGMPFDPDAIPSYDPESASLEQLDADGLSMFLIKNSVDGYRTENLGARGTRITLTKYLPNRDITHYEETPEQAAASAVSCELATIRPMRPGEAIEVSRLIWRSYGYSYVNEDLYYPERIVARQREGLLRPLVAVNDTGQIVGHVALMKEDARSELAEWGAAVVHPDCRGGGIMKRMVGAIDPLAAEHDERAVYAHAVTNHPYTQKTCLGFGYQPVALLLGYAPASLSFRRISDHLRQRESTFICVKPRGLQPSATLAAPERHRPLLSALWRSLGVGVGWDETEPAPPAERSSQVESRIVTALNIGLLLVRRVGADLPSLLAHLHRRLCNERVDIVYLYLDQESPGAMTAWEEAEHLGYFLAGIHPMEPWEHTVVLQFLNNSTVDFSVICAYGEAAQNILDYVCRESGEGGHAPATL